MIKRWIMLVLVILLMITAGCQAAPESSAVTSKNSGAFEAALESTEETNSDDAENNEGTSFVYQTSFTNTAGDISFTVDVEIPAVSTAVPVIQVRPEEITAEQAQEIAAVLFDGAVLYEYTEELSKSELEDIILSIQEKLSDYDGLLAYYGDEDTVAYIQSMYEEQLEAYESDYATAKDTVEPELCQWTFYPETHYSSYGDSDAMYIMATVQPEDSWPMVFSVCNRNASDYLIHDIFVYTDATRTNTNEVYSAALDRPSEEEIESIREKARAMLDDMGFSDWVIDSCEVVTRALSTGQYSYPVKISASPTYEGIPVIKQDQIMNLTTDDIYASNYNYEEINIEFCAGMLSSFEYQAPLEVVDIVSSNAAILTPEEIAAQLETQMRVTDISSYQSEDDADFSTVTGVSMTISEVEFGLVRIRILNDATDFYLVPAYTFRGSSELTYSDGMTDRLDDVIPLTINAVDGTIINTSQGY